MSKSKVQPESNAKPRELQYVLMSGKHSRRQPDGTSIIFRPGDIVPNLSDEELAAFGDKFLSVEQFEARVSGFNESQQAEAEMARAARDTRAKQSQSIETPRDKETESRAEKIEQMREAETGKRAVNL